MRMPGTKWCGKGRRTDRLSDVGAYGPADACCRQHDLGCTDNIPGLASKHGLYNWRLHPVMLCECDDR